MIGANLTESRGQRLVPFHTIARRGYAISSCCAFRIARIGDARVPVGEGDCSRSPGRRAPAPDDHEGTEPLVYLCISASREGRRRGVPDSPKVAASAGTFEKPIHRWISRQGEA